MKKILWAVMVCLVSVSFSSHTVANPTSYGTGTSAGLNISTLGVGASAKYFVNSFFGIRALINGFRINKAVSDDQMTVKGKLTLFTAGFTFDIHPFQNGFFIAPGVLYNGNKLKVTASANNNVTLEDGTIVLTPAQIGTATTTLHFKNKLSPYIGLGYDGSITKGWSFLFELGVLFQGPMKSKSVKMTGRAQDVQADLDALRHRFTKDVNKISLIKTWPVVSLGVRYKF